MATEFFEIWILWMKTWLRKTLHSIMNSQREVEIVESFVLVQ